MSSEGMGEKPPLRYYISRIIFAGIVLIVCSWVLLPIIMSILYAFSTPKDFYSPTEVIPLHHTFANIKKLLDLGAAQATYE